MVERDDDCPARPAGVEASKAVFLVAMAETSPGVTWLVTGLDHSSASMGRDTVEVGM